LGLKAYILQKVIPHVFFLHLQMFPSSNSCFIAVALVSLWKLNREFSVRWILIASLATMPWTSCRMDNRCWDDSHWWHSPLHDKNILLGCYLTTPQSSASL
jgi:hypothetical protein